MASVDHFELLSTNNIRESSSSSLAQPHRKAPNLAANAELENRQVNSVLSASVTKRNDSEDPSGEEFNEFAKSRSEFKAGSVGKEQPVSTGKEATSKVSNRRVSESANQWQLVDLSERQFESEWPAASVRSVRRPNSVSYFQKEASPNSVSSATSCANPPEREQFLEHFLAQIYDRTSNCRSGDSDTFTEASFSESFLSFVNCPASLDGSPVRQRSVFAQPNPSAQASDFEPERADDPFSALTYRRTEAQLNVIPRRELLELVRDLQAHVQRVSSQLVRQARRRDHALHRSKRYCDVITAILQAASEHRRVDRNLKFTIEPQQSDGENAFSRWKETMRAVARLPCGLPSDFRRRMWLALADSHICSIKVDWERTKRFAFNERQNPDDCALGLQIVKDLHRTGYSNFNGQDNEEDRAVLKRVLLGYARWNKHVGYCQGFNVIAALILDVVERREDEALKVFIYLIDHVLPESFFTNNLTALAVEMAVFRDLLKLYVPELSRHLETLQQLARDNNSGNNYEPPLTNVFTMQWFLTLFATCLPHDTVLRLWDIIMLEGCETLLRAALAVWYKLRSHLRAVHSADEFYCLMGSLSQRLLDNQIITADELVRVMFTLCPSPIPNLAELREKYTYNITPFSPTASQHGRGKAKTGLRRAAESVDGAVGCFAAMFADSDSSERRRQFAQNDISRVGPGLFADGDDERERERALAAAAYPGHFVERMSTDVVALRKQYERLTQRHRQANVIITAAHRRYRDAVATSNGGLALPASQPSNVINHLLIGSSSAPVLRQLTVNHTATECTSAALRPAGANSNFVPVSPVVLPAANRPPKLPAQWPGRNAVKWDDPQPLRRVGSLESLHADTSPQTASQCTSQATGLVDRRAPSVPLMSLRELAKRRSSLSDEPSGPIDDTAFRTMLANTIQEQRRSVSRETSVLSTSSTSEDCKSRVNVSAGRGNNENNSSASQSVARDNAQVRNAAPEFATLETSVQQQANTHSEAYERVRGADQRAERRPFSMHQPNPSSLQRIRKMNMNACLQRGYMADVHNVQQVQRRKLYS